MGEWRTGAAGAFRMGLRHGLFCAGCCWAVMALLFVGGVMNLPWIAALSIVVAIEKTGAARRADRDRAGRGADRGRGGELVALTEGRLPAQG